jgi:uncharacterized protein
MKRKIESKLTAWKNNPTRKPLVLLGARQVGKTYCLEKLGQNNFPDFHLFDFMEDPALSQIFKQDLNPERVIRDLSLYSDKNINIDKDLIIFDEVQECPKALASLKYFAQKYPKAFITASGSLLGIGLNDGSFPVGKVDRVRLFPMDFEEFLTAVGQNNLAKIFKPELARNPINEAIHKKLWEYLKYFMITGGLPEIVKTFSENINNLPEAFLETRKRQEGLLQDYMDDISKHSGKLKAVRISAVLKNIPIQLARESKGVKKFVFKDILPNGSRFSLLEAPIEWLIEAGLVIKTPICNKAELPLKVYADEKRFKLYLFDVGILGAMLGLAPKAIFSYDYGSYKGYFAENLVLTEMMAQWNKTIYSWSRNISEIEFLLENEDEIIPIEVKAGISAKAKSLKVYQEKYAPKKAILLSGRPMLPPKGNTLQLPLYLASKLQYFF